MKILDTGRAAAVENMRRDAMLLEQMNPQGELLLHFYEWEGDSATYGCFVDPGNYLDLAAVKERGLFLAKRPTGGGIVFHIWDFAFSVLVPAKYSSSPLENYALINQVVLGAVQEFLGPQAFAELTPSDAAAADSACNRFCMARPTKYDILLEGRKVAGAAQRSRKQGFLHQASIALVRPPIEDLRPLLLAGTQVLEAIYTHTYPLLGSEAAEIEMIQAKQTMRQLIQKHFKSNFIH